MILITFLVAKMTSLFPDAYAAFYSNASCILLVQLSILSLNFVCGGVIIS
jgi:hypothetical protein